MYDRLTSLAEVLPAATHAARWQLVIKAAHQHIEAKHLKAALINRVGRDRHVAGSSRHLSRRGRILILLPELQLGRQHCLHNQIVDVRPQHRQLLRPVDSMDVTPERLQAPLRPLAVAVHPLVLRVALRPSVQGRVCKVLPDVKIPVCAWSAAVHAAPSSGSGIASSC